MTTIQWNDNCPNCMGTNGEEPESLIRLIEHSVPHVFPDVCWYCEDRQRNVISSGDYLHLLRQKTLNHAGVSFEKDQDFLRGLGVDNVWASSTLPNLLKRIPPPGAETEMYLKCYLFPGSLADLTDLDPVAPAKSAIAQKETLTFALRRKIVGINPFDYTDHPSNWRDKRAEVVLDFRAIVYCYRVDNFILKSRLVENKVLVSVYQIDLAKPDKEVQVNLLSTHERVFVYE